MKRAYLPASHVTRDWRECIQQDVLTGHGCVLGVNLTFSFFVDTINYANLGRTKAPAEHQESRA